MLRPLKNTFSSVSLLTRLFLIVVTLKTITHTSTDPRPSAAAHTHTYSHVHAHSTSHCWTFSWDRFIFENSEWKTPKSELLVLSFNVFWQLCDSLKESFSSPLLPGGGFVGFSLKMHTLLLKVAWDDCIFFFALYKQIFNKFIYWCQIKCIYSCILVIFKCLWGNEVAFVAPP